MTTMANSAGAPVPQSRFEAFLLASVGEDTHDNGMPLSVLSALARQNLDPWEEAALLASLPRETATQKLTSLIAALPNNGRSVRADPSVNAARLIALLPAGGNHNNQSVRTIPGSGTTHPWRNMQLALYVVCMLIILALQWLAATHRKVESNIASAATSGTQTSRATVGRSARH